MVLGEPAEIAGTTGAREAKERKLLVELAR